MVYVLQKLKAKNKSVTLRLAPLAYNDAYKKFLESAMRYFSSKAIPIKCFVSHRATDPFFWKSQKKKNPESLVKKQVLYFTSTRSCLINTKCLKLSSILRFCSLFRHLIVLLIYIFYHLIISCRLNVRFNMQSCVHCFFF